MLKCVKSSFVLVIFWLNNAPWKVDKLMLIAVKSRHWKYSTFINIFYVTTFVMIKLSILLTKKLKKDHCNCEWLQFFNVLKQFFFLLCVSVFVCFFFKVESSSKLPAILEDQGKSWKITVTIHAYIWSRTLASVKVNHFSAFHFIIFIFINLFYLAKFYLIQFLLINSSYYPYSYAFIIFGNSILIHWL